MIGITGTGRGVVLAYHRVLPDGPDPLGLNVPPSLLEAQLRALARIADVVPLAGVLERHSGRRIAVTFDDGYADNAEQAAPVLAAAGVPATFFVVTGDPRRELWWDRLEHVLTDGPLPFPTVDLTAGGRRVRIDVRTEAGRARALRALNRRLRVRPPSEIEAVLDLLGERSGRVPEPCARHRRLDADAVRRLAETSGLSVGSHTRSHAMLTALTGAALDDELTRSRADLERIAGTCVSSVAYPFGNEGSFDDSTLAAARRAGYEVGCINLPGVVQRRTNRLAVPRVQVWDWPPDRLVAHIEACFDGAFG